MRLLIVEDNQRLQELLAQFLNRTGYRVDTAASVADFHASVATVQYDLIIVDLGLPDGDGLTAIRALRDKGQSMPILVITARGSIEARVSRMAMLAMGILLPMRFWSAVPALQIVNNRHGKNEECSPEGNDDLKVLKSQFPPAAAFCDCIKENALQRNIFVR